MARAKVYHNSSSGYADWGIKRTLREAESVARWNPWTAHEWMEEAGNRLSLDNCLYQEFDDVAARINSRWKIMLSFRWFKKEDFWKKHGQLSDLKYIESTEGNIEFAEELDSSFVY